MMAYDINLLLTAGLDYKIRMANSWFVDVQKVCIYSMRKSDKGINIFKCVFSLWGYFLESWSV